jgi:hypothetical protein
MPTRRALLAIGVAVLLIGGSPAFARTSSGLPPKVKPAGPRTGEVVPTRPGLRSPGVGDVALGFCGGDDWEPEIATDAPTHHVYAVITHFPGDRTCDPASGNPNQIYIQVSSDAGRTFGPPHVVADTVDGKAYPAFADPVIAVDPVAGSVFVSYLAYGLPPDPNKTIVAVATSTDFGATFTATQASGARCASCDHPWTIAYGNDVYTAYSNNYRGHYISHSSDGGATWTEALVLKAGAVAFPEGAVMDANHDAIFAWGDCLAADCTGDQAATYRVSNTLAGTTATAFSVVATAPAGPACPYDPHCGFAFFGIQDDIGIDAAGNLYLVWQDGQDHAVAGSPPIVQLSSSSDGGRTWSYVGRVDDKTSDGCAASACYALFPRVEGGGPGHVNVIWMDDRLGSPIDHENGWNVWLRSSADGGASWLGPSRRVSPYDPTIGPSRRNGFLFPYGDYQGITLLGGRALMVWGEGWNYAGGPTAPGRIVYRSMGL